MNWTETKENGKALMIAVAVFIVAAMCQMFSMLKSGFIGTFGTEVGISFLTLLTFICVVFKIFRMKSAVFTASFASVLLFANWSQLMLYYTCNSDTDVVLKKAINFMLYVIASIIATWAAFMFLNKIKQFRNLCLVLFSVMAIGISMFIIFCSGINNNTSTTTSGLQPAILLMFFMLYAFSGAMAGNNGFLTKIVYLALFWLMMASLALKHEFGIPAMAYTACMITYLFFNKSKKELWFALANIIIPVAGFAFIMIDSPAIREDTIEKLTTRFAENDHWLMAEANLQASSLFGSESYDVFLAEASSDYSLNVDAHYWGYLWIGVMLFSFFIMSISVYKNIMSIKNDNILSNIRKLAYSAVCVIVVYNVLDNICGAPVIGVQMIGCGVSKSMALLSGILIGSVIADPQKMKSSVLLFLKKIGVITATA